jgi:5-methylcytosine-specific restriction endonuclease McrA
MATPRIKLRPSVRLEIAANQAYNCHICSGRLGPIFHIDHIKALCNGGSNVLKNLCALCPNCHAYKTNDDLQRLWDYKEEIRTGKSRYFNKLSRSYIGGEISGTSIKPRSPSDHGIP